MSGERPSGQEAWERPHPEKKGGVKARERKQCQEASLHVSKGKVQNQPAGEGS